MCYSDKPQNIKTRQLYAYSAALFTLLCCSHVLRRFAAGELTRSTAFSAALNIVLLATGFKNPAVSMMQKMSEHFQQTFSAVHRQTLSGLKRIIYGITMIQDHHDGHCARNQRKDKHVQYWPATVTCGNGQGIVTMVRVLAHFSPDKWLP